MLLEPDFFINSNNMIKHCGLRRYRGNICRDVISLHNKEKIYNFSPITTAAVLSRDR